MKKYITIKEALNEFYYNNYSVVKISGVIEFSIIYNNIKCIIDNDSFCIYDLNNTYIRINKHQIMKILKESDMLTIELDNSLKINILKNKGL